MSIIQFSFCPSSFTLSVWLYLDASISHIFSRINSERAKRFAQSVHAVGAFAFVACLHCSLVLTGKSQLFFFLSKPKNGGRFMRHQSSGMHCNVARAAIDFHGVTKCHQRRRRSDHRDIVWLGKKEYTGFRANTLPMASILYQFAAYKNGNNIFSSHFLRSSAKRCR